MMPEYSVYFASERHRDFLVEISLLWKIRQQLFVGLGISQVIIVGALQIKLLSIKNLNWESNNCEVLDA